MAFPAAGVFTAGPNVTNGQTYLEDWLAQCKELAGAAAETELTISSGSITATRWVHSIDTESDAAADDLTNIDVAGLEDGSIVVVHAENAARVPTLLHDQGGAGEMLLRDGQSCVLDALSKYVAFYVDKSGTAFLQEIARWGFDAPAVLEANTAVAASPNLIGVDEVGKILTNEGTTAANYHTLPAARSGLGPYTFVVQDADGIRIVAGAGDTIRIAASASPAAGYIEAATIGNVVTLYAINATEWVAISYVGTWTVSV